MNEPLVQLTITEMSMIHKARNKECRAAWDRHKEAEAIGDKAGSAAARAEYDDVCAFMDFWSNLIRQDKALGVETEMSFICTHYYNKEDECLRDGINLCPDCAENRYNPPWYN